MKLFFLISSAFLLWVAGSTVCTCSEATPSVDVSNVDKLSISTKAVNSYLAGYLRAEYTDTSVNPPQFVQAISQVIGACFQFRVGDPLKFRKLTKVSLDSINNQATLYYSGHKVSDCSDAEVDSSTTTENINSTVRTSNNVNLRRMMMWTGSLTVALRALPGNARGIAVQYFGAQKKCRKEPFQYRVATENCANYPEFHGRIQCDENDALLRYTRFDFSPTQTCTSAPEVYKVQPFNCTNQGTDDAPSYEASSCLITDVKRPLNPPKSPPKSPPMKPKPAADHKIRRAVRSMLLGPI